MMMSRWSRRRHRVTPTNHLIWALPVPTRKALRPRRFLRRPSPTKSPSPRRRWPPPSRRRRGWGRVRARCRVDAVRGSGDGRPRRRARTRAYPSSGISWRRGDRGDRVVGRRTCASCATRSSRSTARSSDTPTNIPVRIAHLFWSPTQPSVPPGSVND